MSGKPIKNMEQFASVSGISRPTVSKYFNDPTSVRPSTRSRIESALERYDYRPNIYAINQNRRLTRNVGIIVPYLFDPFFAEIARSIERLCIEAGYRPILFNSHGDPATERENLDALSALKPAGALIAPLGRASDQGEIERFCEMVPTVLFDSNINGIAKAFVGSNNAQSIDLIVKHLCNTGEPPSLFEIETAPNPNANKRRDAYIAAMERLGHQPDLIQVKGEGWDFEEIGFLRGTEALRDRRFRTNTVLCSNDRLAIGLLAAAHECGLRVGKGGRYALRIAGHDDHPFSRFTCPSLTTVSQDYASISATSLETLMRVADLESENKERETTLFDGTLVVRQSA